MNQSSTITILVITFFTACTSRKNQIPEKVNYSRAVLFSIDSSIYSEHDTVSAFSDGKPAYTFFLGGQSFIDSSGKPIHDRYQKFELSEQQNLSLKDSFLYELCDDIAHSCLSVYRDVLVLYDSNNNVIQQAQICFGCGDASIYPYRDYMCQEESDLDFKHLKRFISSIKE